MDSLWPEEDDLALRGNGYLVQSELVWPNQKERLLVREVKRVLHPRGNDQPPPPVQEVKGLPLLTKRRKDL